MGVNLTKKHLAGLVYYLKHINFINQLIMPYSVFIVSFLRLIKGFSINVHER